MKEESQCQIQANTEFSKSLPQYLRRARLSPFGLALQNVKPLRVNRLTTQHICSKSEPKTQDYGDKNDFDLIVQRHNFIVFMFVTSSSLDMIMINVFLIFSL